MTISRSFGLSILATALVAASASADVNVRQRGHEAIARKIHHAYSRDTVIDFESTNVGFLSLPERTVSGNGTFRFGRHRKHFHYSVKVRVGNGQTREAHYEIIH